jgi:predicted  nucleic acid-binding Zn-ribbon protein
MPHICISCSNVFDSGEDILKGCPVCGCKKFMFTRSGPGETEVQEEQIITRAMGVRIPPRRAKKENTGIMHGPGAEDAPQLQPPKEMEKGLANSGKKEATLESIKITAPGTYELNLPSLFERDELIMAVKEGTYFIDLTSAFKKKKD